MEPGFWHERWQQNQIGFHEGKPNEHLRVYFARLSLASASRVLVPLCGKTEDIPWLLSSGHRVVGVELSESAVEALFQRLETNFTVRREQPFTVYSAPGVDVFVGDIFALTATQLGVVDAVYDRAALVALPEPMRRQYAQHLTFISGAAAQLLISFDYDQSQTNGPPFAVPEAEISSLYDSAYVVEKLAETAISGRLAERCTGSECVWLLTPRALNALQ